MLIFHLKNTIQPEKLVELYAQLFKIPTSDIAEQYTVSEANHRYGCVHYLEGDFRTMFTIYPPTNNASGLTENEEEILLASELSNILGQPVVVSPPADADPWLWLLVEGDTYFMVSEWYPEGHDDEYFGISLQYDTKKVVDISTLIKK